MIHFVQLKEAQNEYKKDTFLQSDSAIFYHNHNIPIASGVIIVRE
jgi:hypothetical protein